MSPFIFEPRVSGVVLEQGKGALYRETLQATGCYVGRIVIATAEFAPMPPSDSTGLPRRFHPDGHRMRFFRHGRIYRSDVVENQTQNKTQNQTQNQTLRTGSNRLPPVRPEPR